MGLISTHMRMFDASEKAPGEKPAEPPEFVNGVEIVKHDPVHGMLYKWELEYQRQQARKRGANPSTPAEEKPGPAGGKEA
jgi:hypothetical protein